jgi:hypothetical protein
MGLCGGVAEIGGLPGLMLTAGPAAPGIKTFAFGFRTNSFAFGFKLDFFAVAALVDVVDETGEADEVPLVLLEVGDISCCATLVSVSDFCL